MVMTTGLPSLDFAWTTKDSATTLTSVNPAFCKSCLIFCAAARSWVELLVLEPLLVEPLVACEPDWFCEFGVCAKAAGANTIAATAVAMSTLFIRCFLSRVGSDQQHDSDERALCCRALRAALPTPSISGALI
jgi:hypothetical protein